MTPEDKTHFILKYGWPPERPIDRREWLKTLPQDFLIEYGYANLSTSSFVVKNAFYISANASPEKIYIDLMDYECRKHQQMKN